MCNTHFLSVVAVERPLVPMAAELKRYFLVFLSPIVCIKNHEIYVLVFLEMSMHMFAAEDPWPHQTASKV